MIRQPPPRKRALQHAGKENLHRHRHVHRPLRPLDEIDARQRRKPLVIPSVGDLHQPAPEPAPPVRVPPPVRRGNLRQPPLRESRVQPHNRHGVRGRKSLAHRPHAPTRLVMRRRQHIGEEAQVACLTAPLEAVEQRRHARNLPAPQPPAIERPTHAVEKPLPVDPHRQIPRTRGSPCRSITRAVSAQTSASSRSGERPEESPSGPKSHIWSSSSAKAPAWATRPCS